MSFKRNRCEANRVTGHQCRNSASWRIGNEYFCQNHAGAKALSVLEYDKRAERV